MMRWGKEVGRSRGQTRSAHRIVHPVGVGFFLGKETARGIWGMGELGSMDEVAHWWTAATTTSCSTSSHSPSRGVPMREVKVPLAVIVVAFGNKRTFECQDDGYFVITALGRIRLCVPPPG